MKTYGFIGSDKNAGKTTVFNYVYQHLCRQSGPASVCLASTGINGESLDAWEGHPKPEIVVRRQTTFVTAVGHLRPRHMKFDDLQTFSPPEFSKTYLLATARSDFPVVLEGPNTREEILAMKSGIRRRSVLERVLLDGSVDRQFLAHPKICDGFFFSVLLSKRPEQRQKAGDLIRPLSFPACSRQERHLITAHRAPERKSLVFDEHHALLYAGRTIPFCDDALQEICNERQKLKTLIYLNGALSPSLFNFWADFEHVTLVLDNFTLYQNISADPGRQLRFRPRLKLLHPVPTLGIFLRMETGRETLDGLPPMPKETPVYDLFKSSAGKISLGEI